MSAPEICVTHKTLNSPGDAFAYGLGEAAGKSFGYLFVFGVAAIAIAHFTDPAPTPAAPACVEVQPHG